MGHCPRLMTRDGFHLPLVPHSRFAAANVVRDMLVSNAENRRDVLQSGLRQIVTPGQAIAAFNDLVSCRLSDGYLIDTCKEG